MSNRDRKYFKKLIIKATGPLSVVPPPAKVIVHPSVHIEPTAKPVDTTDPSDMIPSKPSLSEQMRARYELFMNDCRSIDRRVDLSKQKYTEGE